MTRRDFGWRAAGLLLSAGACAAGLWDHEGSPFSILYFLGALIGLALMVNGKRVAILLQAERRGHGRTAGAIHEHRLRRYRGADPTSTDASGR